MEKLSVVIITFNEEENIAACIRSVKPVADEIVVLDSYSTDRTEEICREQGVKFFQHKFDGHIQQKNRAITYASHPLILSVDADEQPDETLISSILSVKNNRQADGYKFSRLNHYLGKPIRHSNWYPDTKLRLWDSSKGAWGGSNPHDTFVMRESANVQKIKGDLLHYTFHTFDQHLEQVRKFSAIKARELLQKGKRSNLLKIVFKPAYAFFRSYFLKLGFLDGFYGFLISINTAYGHFLKFVYMYLGQK